MDNPLDRVVAAIELADELLTELGRLYDDGLCPSWCLYQGRDVVDSLHQVRRDLQSGLETRDEPNE